VVFIRVVEPFHQPTGDYVMDPDQVKKIEAEHKQAAEAYLQKISAKASLAGAAVKTEAPYGVPAERLAEYASKNQVDLIVIATHGRSGVSKWVWGSVADRILRSACVPVLMVRAPGCVAGI
jgi:nucleotide-binding universal stress UspA family protein